MQALDLAKEKWNSASRTRRGAFVASVFFVVALLIFGSYWILREDYQVLFSDLSGQDAGAMVTELERMKVPYRLTDNGSTILVEQDMVHKTRLKLMSKGLDLHGTVGFEIFNNTDFGTTEFAQKVNYQRAMQGELARTIMSFEEIKNARVHLVLPDSSLFKRQNAKPKASVSLVMKGDSQLSNEQIAGIQRLVAASVPEIQPSAVTIIDQRGAAVSQQLPADDAEQSSGGRLDTKKRIEEYLTRKVVAVLDRAIGPGKAIVSVDAQLNYDQIKVTREDIMPLPNTTGQNVGAVSRRRETSQGNDLLETDAGSLGGRSVASPSSASSEIEFANGRKVESIVSAPGSLQRLSVGVLVPGMTDPVELAKLKEIVTMAVGINNGRGDAIAVYNVPQDGAPVDPQQAAPAHAEHIDARAPAGSGDGSVAIWALAALAVAALLFFAGRAASSRRPPRMSAEERQKLLHDLMQWSRAEKSQEV